MQYDRSLVAHKLLRWDKFITDYHLPEWNSIPDFGLYMDQVIVLLEHYLSFIPTPAGAKEHIVTSATINNYVRLKIIAYLVMILTMKQSLSISDVQKVIPPMDSSEDEVLSVYEDYSEKFRRLALFFNQQVQSAAEGVRSTEQSSDNAVELLVIESALIAGFSKIFADAVKVLSNPEETDCAARTRRMYWRRNRPKRNKKRGLRPLFFICRVC